MIDDLANFLFETQRENFMSSTIENRERSDTYKTGKTVRDELEKIING